MARFFLDDLEYKYTTEKISLMSFIIEDEQGEPYWITKEKLAVILEAIKQSPTAFRKEKVDNTYIVEFNPEGEFYKDDY